MSNYYLATWTLLFVGSALGWVISQSAVNAGRLSPITGIVTLCTVIGGIAGFIIGLVIDLHMEK